MLSAEATRLGGMGMINLLLPFSTSRLRATSQVQAVLQDCLEAHAFVEPAVRKVQQARWELNKRSFEGYILKD